MKLFGSSWLAAGALAGALLVGAPRPAAACGGFFCNQVPINQTGEQIIFSLTPSHVTAYIQIAYQGDAKDFAWVVPVTAKPDVAVGSQAVFQLVQGQTQPTFRLDWKGDGGFCGAVSPPFADGAAGGATGSRNESVQVVASGEVGPYNYKVLQSQSSAELLEWLNTNGFVQPAEALPLIDHYVQQKMMFLAVKLKQDAGTGDIQPLVLDMPNPEPCVPLILTRIAAKPDMPVLVYVLGNARAIPENWFHVVLDESKIDWFGYPAGRNYNTLVTQAINEAAGHGFVTEYAGVSSIMKDRLWRADQYDTSKLAGITDPAQLMSTLMSFLDFSVRRDPIVLTLLRKHIPMPASVAARNVTEQQFYNNLSAYKADLDAAGYHLDTAAFIKDLNDRLIEPLHQAQLLFDQQPYLTRLLSTVSPDEMTRDPLFVQNGELDPVSNVHVAKAYGMCKNDGTIANLQLELPDGQRISVDGTKPLYQQTWTYGQTLPASRRIELVGPTGKPVVIRRGDAGRFDAALNGSTPELVRMMALAGVAPEPSTGGGCAFGGEARAASPLALLGLAIGGLVRRLRRGRG